jgi:hypothetical protein
MLSTEGVVSALFVRWAANSDIQQRYRDENFYAQFGTSSAQVSPLENGYLKMFHMVFVRKPADAASFINGYQAVFPDEAPFVDRLVREVLMGQQLSSALGIWLANRAQQTGTSLYNQVRCSCLESRRG